jgi:hypothetical protein
MNFIREWQDGIDSEKPGQTVALGIEEKKRRPQSHPDAADN